MNLRELPKSILFWLNIFTVLPFVLFFILASAAGARGDADGSTAYGLMLILTLPFALGVVIADCIFILKRKKSNVGQVQGQTSSPLIGLLIKALAIIVILGILTYIVLLFNTSQNAIKPR